MIDIIDILDRERDFYLLIKDQNVGDKVFENLDDLLSECNLTDFELKKAIGHFNMGKIFPLRVVSRVYDKELCYQVFRLYSRSQPMRDCTVYFEGE